MKRSGWMRVYRSIRLGVLAVSLMSTPGSAGAAAVGHWHFDTGFTDSSAFGSHLSSPIGGVTIAPGLIDGAASFNGSGFLFSGNPILIAGRTNFTAAAFVKASGNPGPDAILLGNFFTNPNAVFSAGMTDHFGAVFGYVADGGNNASAGAINDGNWHHVAMTFDGATIRTYIDGFLGAIKTSSFSTSSTVTEFSVGGKSGPLNPFSGLIDEALFSADVLTVGQIIQLAIVILNNGSSNGVNDFSLSDLIAVYVRNAGCPAGWPSVDPVIDPGAACPSPGAATQLAVGPGGAVRGLRVMDSSTISMSGGTVTGSLTGFNSSTIALSGGTVLGPLTAFNSSSVNMSGGTVQFLTVANSSTSSLTGGSVADALLVQNSATLDWSGGTVGGTVVAQSGGTISIVGTGFARNGIPVPFGDLSIDNGTLTGTLISGDAINNVYSAALSTITLIDEDTDGDGMLNSFEVANGFDPLNADEDLDGIIDGQDDFDADGLGNAAEAETGTNPNLADTDGDGLLDGQEIGTGVFGSEQVITTLANGAVSVYGADVDGDGDIDALSASEFDDKIAWYENTDGLGTFGPQQVISTLAVGAESVFAVDVDGDGDGDVLSASLIDDKIAWYENTDGLGTFGPPQVITTLADFASSVFGADLDGDGDTDVLSASGNDGKVAWYENTDGLGTFGPQQVIATLLTATSVFGTDVDRDGDLDVLAIGGSKVVWYENTNGLGSFGPEQIVSSLIAFGTSVHGADFDRDGNIDVLSASGASDTIAWYENTNGLGSFGPQQVITALTDGPQSVFGIDVDGDGDADVLSASGNDVKIAWYENTDGMGTFGPQKVIALLTDRPHAVFGADLDGDGDTDVLSAEVGTDTIAWFEQTNVANPLVSDTDGDGLLDGFEVNNGFDPLVPDLVSSASNSTTGSFDGSSGTRTVSIADPGVVSKIILSINFAKADGEAFAPPFPSSTPFHNEIVFRLTSPSGTTVNLINAGSFSTGSVNFDGTITFFDDAAQIVNVDPNLPQAGTFLPIGMLDDFVGEAAAGTWSLFIQDTVSQDSLRFRSFTLNAFTIEATSTWLISGTAAGGTIDFIVDGVSLQVITFAGQSATQVAAAIAAAINADPTLAAAGVGAVASGGQVTTNGTVSSTVINDSGINHATAVSALSLWGLSLLLLLLVLFGTANLLRRHVL